MPEPTYLYDPITGRYTNAASGKTLSDEEIREEGHEALIAALTLILVGLTRDLQAGKLDLAAWQLQMSANIKAAHTAVGAVGYGGLAELSPSRLAVLEGAVGKQLGYLDNWARGLADGTAPLDGTMLTRAGLYGQAPRGTWGEVQARQAALHGAAFEKNQLHPADHCAGCLAATDAGWVRLGTLPPPGQRTCRSRCKCRMIYRTQLEMEAT
jgi:hypothetical protein